MVREFFPYIKRKTRFPHASGDGPWEQNRQDFRNRVFPTRVGMVRSAASFSAAASSFSPREWGWSGEKGQKPPTGAVFPTRVGMVRNRRNRRLRRRSFPHASGDGPPCALISTIADAFSPREWGWSELDEAYDAMCDVFPTRVGMVRKALPSPRPLYRFPHASGDGPTGTPVRKPKV